MPEKACRKMLLRTPAIIKTLLRNFAFLALLVICLSGSPFAPGVNTALNFNEGTGTVANDISGNSHSGTLVNGPLWTTGKYGQAISFDGVNDYLNIADHNDYTLNPAQSYTWSAWVKNTNFNSWGTVWSQTLDASNYFYFYAHSTTDAEAGPVTNGISVYWTTGSTKLVVHSNNNVLTNGTWSNITVTYDASQTQANRFTIYVNGIDVTDRTDVVSVGTISSINPTNIRAGSNQPFGEYINAAIDEMRYYTRLLSPTEIISDMNTPIDNTAPTTTITAPINGSNVTGTVNVTANASDDVGVVGVQFQLDGVDLGVEDVAAPYSISWNTTTATDGNHTLTAKARDLAGNIGTSAAVNISASNDLIPPTVSLTSPAAGIINGPVNVNATASDNIGVVGVQFLLNGTNLGAEDLTDPYSISWNTTTVADGQYILTAKARDAAGNITTTANLNVVVHNNPDTQSPTVLLTSPASGIIQGSVSIHANATDNIAVAGVQFLLNGADLGTEVLTPPYNMTWNTNSVADGHYVLSARARDIDGNTAVSPNLNVTVNNLPDTESPSITSVAPTGIIAGIANVTATASDNIGVAGVQFLLNGVNLGGEDTVAPYSYQWNTSSLPDGNYLLSARARDFAGNLSNPVTVATTVRNDAQAPTVNITAPAAGTIAGTIPVSANASDNTIVAGVQFLLNGTNLGIEDITAPYSISWNTTTIANGSYTLTAKARDASGNIQVSAPVVVNVLNLPPDTQYPVVNIISPSPGSVSGSVNVTANATDNVGVAGVQFYLNGSVFGTEDLTAPYTMPWNSYSVANGTYTLTAVARDAAGNTTTSSAVTINVNNAPDSQLPIVTLTSPTATSVTGIVTVKATATDNIGVAGVQFFLDGNELGTEDVTSPYSIVWNSGNTNAGNHIISVRARDFAGNLSITAFVTVNVVIPSPPAISNISVNSITANSAIVTWTTNVPASSKVNYDLNTSYGLYTLIDPVLTTSHAVTVIGLGSASLYHYKVESADSNGVSYSPDNTFTTAPLASSPGSLNGRPVRAYPANKIIPWTSNPANGYDTVMYLAWKYLLTSVPNDPSTGKAAYYSRSYLDPNTQEVENWPHNPAGLYGMLTESALKYYGYSGNADVMQLANDVALWHLDHGMTLASDNWPSVPYSSGDAGSLTYDGADVGNSNGQGDGNGYLEPDKIGELANAWLQLYKYGGNTRFRDAAIQAGNVLSAKIRTGTVNQSPWPFRVNAHTGDISEQYCANVTGPISLLDNLIACGLGDTASYRSARNTAWNWMMTYPMVNNIWTQYFEDVSEQSNYDNNLNQYDAMMVARYLLDHPQFDPNWENHVRGLITWVEDEFADSDFGATIINEQEEFLYPMGSHTSRYASVNALLYEKTGDLAAKEKAYRSFNWATYMASNLGVVIDGPDVGNQWFTDGYGDYIRHFMTGIGAVPEWSPSNQTHLLRSSSVVKNISYGLDNVSYTTYDANSVEVIHVDFDPQTVMADSVILPRRSDLSQPGWTLDVATKALRIYHANGTHVTISSGTTHSICPGETTYFICPEPGTGYSYQWQVDSTGTGFVDLYNSANYYGTNTDTIWVNNAPTTCYGYKYRCIVTRNGVSLTSPSFELKFSARWMGSEGSDWGDPSNWSCNYVPDAKTDVIIAGSPHNPVIGTNVTIHSVTLSPGVVITIGAGLILNITGK